MKLNLNDGFSMIEVLVTLFILSVGLLGVAGLQATSLRFNQNSYYKSQAVVLATDIVDRIRANKTGADTNLYIGFLADTSISSLTKDCFNVTCTTAEMALYDIEAWALTLQSVLPAGQGRVVGNSVTNVYSITIMWDGARNGATGTACNDSNTNDLKCYQVSVRI